MAKEITIVKLHCTRTSRLVTKGYAQIERLDYRETFAPIVKLVTLIVFSW